MNNDSAGAMAQPALAPEYYEIATYLIRSIKRAPNLERQQSEYCPGTWHLAGSGYDEWNRRKRVIIKSIERLIEEGILQKTFGSRIVYSLNTSYEIPADSRFWKELTPKGNWLHQILKYRKPTKEAFDTLDRLALFLKKDHVQGEFMAHLLRIGASGTLNASQNAVTTSKNIKAPKSSPKPLIITDNSGSDDDIIELQPMRVQKKGPEQTMSKAALPKSAAKRPLSAIDSGNEEEPMPQAKRPRILSGAKRNTNCDNIDDDDDMIVDTGPCSLSQRLPISAINSGVAEKSMSQAEQPRVMGTAILNTDFDYDNDDDDDMAFGTEPSSLSRVLDATGLVGRAAEISASNVQTPVRALATGNALPPTPESMEPERYKNTIATPGVSGGAASKLASQNITSDQPQVETPQKSVSSSHIEDAHVGSQIPTTAASFPSAEPQESDDLSEAWLPSFLETWRSMYPLDDFDVEVEDGVVSYKCFDCWEHTDIPDQSRLPGTLVMHLRSLEHTNNLIARMERRHEPLSQEEFDSTEMRRSSAEEREGGDGLSKYLPVNFQVAEKSSSPVMGLSKEVVSTQNGIVSIDAGQLGAILARLEKVEGAIREDREDSNREIDDLKGRVDRLETGVRNIHEDLHKDVLKRLPRAFERIAILQGSLRSLTNNNDERLEALEAQANFKYDPAYVDPELTLQSAAGKISELEIMVDAARFNNNVFREKIEELETGLQEEESARQRVCDQATEASERLEKEIKMWAKQGQITSKRLTREAERLGDEIEEVKSMVSARSADRI